MLRGAVSRGKYREKSAAYGAQLRGIDAATIVINANPATPPSEGTYGAVAAARTATTLIAANTPTSTIAIPCSKRWSKLWP